jgi:hypothetical protein
MRYGAWVALAALPLLAAPARAQIVINSSGKGPVVIERDQGGGDGVVVHVGRMEIHSSDDVLNAKDFERSPLDPNNIVPMDSVRGLSIRLTVSRLHSAARTDGERIAELTRLLQQMNDAATRQCEPVAAVFGKPCLMTEWNVRANFQPSFNAGPQNGASASISFDIAPPAAALKPN